MPLQGGTGTTPERRTEVAVSSGGSLLGLSRRDVVRVGTRHRRLQQGGIRLRGREVRGLEPARTELTEGRLRDRVHADDLVHEAAEQVTDLLLLGLVPPHRTHVVDGADVALALGLGDPVLARLVLAHELEGRPGGVGPPVLDPGLLLLQRTRAVLLAGLLDLVEEHRGVDAAEGRLSLLHELLLALAEDHRRSVGVEGRGDATEGVAEEARETLGLVGVPLGAGHLGTELLATAEHAAVGTPGRAAAEDAEAQEEHDRGQGPHVAEVLHGWLVVVSRLGESCGFFRREAGHTFARIDHPPDTPVTGKP